MLEKIVKLTPIAGSLLIFSGVLKQIFFYWHFNVRIIDYLEFQEIVTSFLGDLNIIIVFGFIMTLITLVALNFLGKKTQLNIDELFERLLISIYPRRFKYFLGFLLAIFVTISLIYFEKIGYNYFVIYLIIFFSLQMLTYLFLHKSENGKVNIPNFYGLLLLGSSLTISLYLFAKHDIQTVENNTTETTILIEDDVINLNSKSKDLYLGKTNKFVFIKIDSLNSTIVIPVDKIKQYIFKY